MSSKERIQFDPSKLTGLNKNEQNAINRANSDWRHRNIEIQNSRVNGKPASTSIIRQRLLQNDDAFYERIKPIVLKHASITINRLSEDGGIELTSTVPLLSLPQEEASSYVENYFNYIKEQKRIQWRKDDGLLSPEQAASQNTKALRKFETTIGPTLSGTIVNKAVEGKQSSKEPSSEFQSNQSNCSIILSNGIKDDSEGKVYKKRLQDYNQSREKLLTDRNHGKINEKEYIQKLKKLEKDFSTATIGYTIKNATVTVTEEDEDGVVKNTSIVLRDLPEKDASEIVDEYIKNKQSQIDNENAFSNGEISKEELEKRKTDGAKKVLDLLNKKANKNKTILFSHEDVSSEKEDTKKELEDAPPESPPKTSESIENSEYNDHSPYKIEVSSVARAPLGSVASDFAKTYNSFSGTDMVATFELPVPGGSSIVKVVGELTSISYSTYSTKSPVRVLGNMNAVGYVFGQRAIAGSMVFLVFDKHWAISMMREYAKRIGASAHFLVDELPPINITISMSNEYGHKAKLSLFGVTFVMEGQTMSIQDMYTENTYEYRALDMEYLDDVTSVASSRKDAQRSRYLPQAVNHTSSPSSLASSAEAPVDAPVETIDVQERPEPPAAYDKLVPETKNYNIDYSIYPNYEALTQDIDRIHNIVKQKIENAIDENRITPEQKKELDENNECTWEETKKNSRQNYEKFRDIAEIPEDVDSPTPSPSPRPSQEKKQGEDAPPPIGEGTSNDAILDSINENIEQFKKAKNLKTRPGVNAINGYIKKQIVVSFREGKISKEDFDILTQELDKVYQTKIAELKNQ